MVAQRTNIQQSNMKGGIDNVLQVQVQYWTLLENVRHNKATEGISADTLAETIRHNKVAERQNQSSINQGWTSLAIQRSNVELQRQRNVLQKQANDIAYMNAMSNAANAATNRYNAETQRSLGYGNLAVARQNAQSQSVSAAASAKQATNSANANIIREKELKVNKALGFGNLVNQYTGNILRLGGSLLR